ncbi:MAG: DEAD/DEAH box helicase [Syntrophorhabdales bacterium]|jgi:ATP-dependent RNA helicase DeaD
MESTTFEEMRISKEMKKAVAAMGFEELTPIQSRAIPLVLEGKDVIGQARTGTGKTLAFGLPIIESLSPKGRNLEALILCPTRELAVQVADEIKRLARYRRDAHIVAVYGGQPIQKQLTSLKKGARIIVGTPGRLMDHMNRGTILLDSIRTVVLDEADRMLDMGFVDDMKTILWAMPEERQTLLFSATIPESVMDLVDKFQKNPIVVNVSGDQVTVPEVDQTFFEVKPWMKLEMLCRLIDTYTPTSSLVFCNTKRRVDQIVRDLQQRGYRVDSLHGDMPQSRRDHAMSRFRKKLLRVLVATDVAARGIDVDDIEAVINYDVPQDDLHYVHRIGRTARMGKGGRAFTLVLPDQLSKLREIQEKANTRIRRQILPRLRDEEKKAEAQEA